MNVESERRLPQRETRWCERNSYRDESRHQGDQELICLHETIRVNYLTSCAEGRTSRSKKSASRQDSLRHYFDSFNRSGSNPMKYLTLNNFNVFWLVVLFVYTIAVMVCHLLPHTYRFDYQKVVPAKYTFEIWEPLYFFSYAKIKRRSELQFNDILRCDNDNDSYWERKIAFWESTLIKNKKMTYNPTNSWKYGEPWPSEPSTCRLESQICVDTDLDWRKCQTIMGEYFRVE